MHSQEAPALRRALVQQLRAGAAITRPDVERAFLRVPREIFVPHVSPATAYRDQAIPFKFDEDGSPISSSSQPAIMALMLEQLDLRRGQRVLEVGAGSGYNAALLAELAGVHGSVTSIDIDEELVAGARQKLARAGYAGVQVLCADGLRALAQDARYDRILLTASSNEIAAAWIHALPEGGRIVLPLIFGLMQASVGFIKRKGALQSTSVVPADFMMLRTLSATSRLTILGGETPSIRVRTKGTHVDSEALLRNLAGPAQSFSLDLARPNMWALALWIDLHDAQFTRIAAHDLAAERGLVPGYATAPSSQAFISTEGLCDGKSLCLFREAAGERIELAAYGEAGALAQRLRSHVSTWAARGYPTQAQLQIHAYPDFREASDAAIVLRSADSTTIVQYGP